MALVYSAYAVVGDAHKWLGQYPTEAEANDKADASKGMPLVSSVYVIQEDVDITGEDPNIIFWTGDN